MIYRKTLHTFRDTKLMIGGLQKGTITIFVLLKTKVEICVE